MQSPARQECDLGCARAASGRRCPAARFPRPVRPSVCLVGRPTNRMQSYYTQPVMSERGAVTSHQLLTEDQSSASGLLSPSLIPVLVDPFASCPLRPCLAPLPVFFSPTPPGPVPHRTDPVCPKALLRPRYNFLQELLLLLHTLPGKDVHTQSLGAPPI